MYDWKIGLKKLGLSSLLALIGVFVAWLQTENLPTHMLVYIPMVIGVLNWVQNYIKHS